MKSKKIEIAWKNIKDKQKNIPLIFKIKNFPQKKEIKK